MTQPLRVMVRRYECPHCARRRASKAATAAHIGRCWHNPDNRTCKTCTHFQPADCCGMANVYGCYTPMCPVLATCAAGVDLGTNPPVVDCVKWAPADGVLRDGRG